MIWLVVLGAESAVEVDPPPYRYLIVVDSSSSMARQKDTTADAIGKLIATGINGRIQTGDLLGVWTITDKLNRTAFGPRMWVDAERPEIAGKVFNLVREGKSAKTANLGLVIAGIKEVARASGSLTVFLVTDGSVPVQGTPFDDAINEIFQGHSAAMKKAKTPFVVVISAHGGEMVSQAVSPGGAKIYIPPVLKPPTDLAFEQDLYGIKRAETNSVDQAAAGRGIAKTNAPKALSVDEIAEILLKQQTERTNPPAAAAVSVVAGDTNGTGAGAIAGAKPVATESAAVASPVVIEHSREPANASDSNLTAPTPATASAPVAAVSEKAPDVSNPSVRPAPGEPSTPAAGAEESNPSPEVQQTAAILPPSPSELSRKYLLTAGGFLLVALVLGGLLFRWRRPRAYPSLITRSLRERERE